jgi:hypothetical protein
MPASVPLPLVLLARPPQASAKARIAARSSRAYFMRIADSSANAATGARKRPAVKPRNPDAMVAQAVPSAARAIMLLALDGRRHRAVRERAREGLEVSPDANAAPRPSDSVRLGRTHGPGTSDFGTRSRSPACPRNVSESSARAEGRQDDDARRPAKARTPELRRRATRSVRKAVASPHAASWV